MTSAYRIGAGVAEITDTAIGLPMQGMADQRQVTTGVESALFARAFVVMDASAESSATCVAIVIADIWAATRRVKDAVLARLADAHLEQYGGHNLLLAGTHTHSAPGGFSGNLLYDFDFDRGGCDEATVACIADGCAQAIAMADSRLSPGRIYVNRGEVQDCGGNRSPAAYLLNPQAERDHWGADTDREMLLLKFVKLDDAGHEQPIGLLNWYAIHPTDRGQKNTLVTGDNKGYAAWLFEQRPEAGVGQTEPFVAAFANANCGDVSPNVELGHIPDGVHDQAQMQKHGTQQFQVAEALFQAATQEVTGPVDYRHTRVDLSDLQTGPGGARTWPAALGISFAAGSTEDSVPEPDLGIREGITAENMTIANALIAGVAGLGLGAIFGVSPIDEALAAPEREGQLPKPSVLLPGLEHPAVVPQALPVQLLRIGTVAIVGIPGELTTMAGRRLRTTVLEAAAESGIVDVALGTYANEYAGYITTLEEYSSQQYEGASTLFGPHTLEAYQLTAAALATAIAHGTPAPPGPSPSPWTSPHQRRYRFRNLSSQAVKLRVYNTDDSLHLLTLPNGEKTIAPGEEAAFPEREFTGPELPTITTVTVWASDRTQPTMSAGELMTISADGSIAVGEYTPPARPGT
jgi:neutral ceramidase